MLNFPLTVFLFMAAEYPVNPVGGQNISKFLLPCVQGAEHFPQILILFAHWLLSLLGMAFPGDNA